MSDETATTDESVLRVVKGAPTPEELAAVVTVVAARAAAAAASTAPASTAPGSGAWADPGARHRTSHRPGPDAWRRSASR